MDTIYSQPREDLTCTIKVRGALDRHWSAWFDNMTITNEVNGEAVLRGLLPDQAALYGLLKKIRDLGMSLVSVNPFPFNEPPIEQVRKATTDRLGETK